MNKAPKKPAAVSKDKSLITVSAVYKNGIPLFVDKKLVSDTRLLESQIDAFRVVELRFVVPTREAEDLYDSLKRGEVELLIQDIPPKI